MLPLFIRLPKPRTVCPFTSLTRTKMSELCVPSAANNWKPAVPATCLKTSRGGRPPSAIKRGIYLVPTAKLLAYLEATKAA